MTTAAARPMTLASAPPSGGWALLLRVVREQSGGIALGVGAGLLWSAGKVSVPLLVRQAIDQGIAPADLRASWLWGLGIAGAGLVSATFTGLRRYLAFLEGRTTERRLRQQLLDHILGLSFSFHDRAQTGQLMSRANTDLGQVNQLITLVPLTLSNALIVLSVTVILLFMQPLLAVLALGSLPFVNVLGRRFSERLHPAVRGLQEEAAQLASVVEESVAGVRVIKGFGAQGVQAKRLGKEAGDVFDMAMLAAHVRSRYLPAIDLVPSLGLVAVLAYGGHLVLAQELTIGTLIMFNFFVLMLIQPLRQLGQIVAQTQRAVAAADRVASLLAVAPAIVDAPSPTRLPPQQGSVGEVRFEGVKFGYGGAAPPVVDGLDFTLKAGESVALVGATGCGKSTVAKLIPRFYDIDSGCVRLDGIDVRQIPLGELRGAVGIVFEDTFLFSDSVAANIAFARPDASSQDVERAARLAGAHDFIADMPEGYATPIGERGFSLSGGQRQRIAIARAILADPRVLILDDATSSVDPEKEHEIRDAMAEVMRDRTTLVIAHRAATVALADRVLFLEKGRVAAEGTHESLLASVPAYRAVWAADLAADGGRRS